MRDFAAEAEQCRLAGDPHGAIEIAEACLAHDSRNDRARIALALALIEVGEIPRARVALVAAFPQKAWKPETPPPVPEAAALPELAAPPVVFAHAAAEHEGLGIAALGEDELESAFANAETNPDEMMSANRVVEQTLEYEHTALAEAGFDITESPTYATETMALLLEEQGRSAQAELLRESLAGDFRDDFADEFQDELQGSLEDDMLAEFAPPSEEAAAEDWARAGVGPDHANRVRIMTTLESWLYNVRRVAAGRERESRAGGSATS